MAITKIPAAGFTGNNFRNIIINGDMSIAQRGTSSSGITSGGYYTVDRWRTSIGIGTWTVSQDTDVPTGQGFATSLKLDCTTADASPSAASTIVLQQRFEGQMLQYLKFGTANAESLTLSFWVKSNKTGTYIAELFHLGVNRQISKSYTIDSANTWEKKTITFAGDTIATFVNNNVRYLDFNLWLAAGSDLTSGTLNTSWGASVNANRAVGQVNIADSTANEWYITGVQLEAGTTASDFEFLPYDVNLDRCQRYYAKYYTLSGIYVGYGSGVVEATTIATIIVKYPKTIRATPSLTQSTTGLYDGNAVRAVTSVGNVYRGNESLNVNLTASGGGLTVGRGCVWVAQASSSAYIALDAEL